MYNITCQIFCISTPRFHRFHYKPNLNQLPHLSLQIDLPFFLLNLSLYLLMARTVAHTWQDLHDKGGRGREIAENFVHKANLSLCLIQHGSPQGSTNLAMATSRENNGGAREEGGQWRGLGWREEGRWGELVLVDGVRSETWGLLG